MAYKYDHISQRVEWVAYKTPLNHVNLNNIETRIDHISNFLFDACRDGIILGPTTSIGNTGTDIPDYRFAISSGEDRDIAVYTDNSIHLFTDSKGENPLLKLKFDAYTPTESAIHIKSKASIGYNCEALGEYSTATGYKTKTGGDYDGTDERYAAAKEADDSTLAETGKPYAEWGFYAHSEGYLTHALGYASHTEGTNTLAVLGHAHAEGYGTIAGAVSHAEGYYSKALGMHSHSEGESTTSEGKFSHAENRNTVAKGVGSHAEGSTTQAIGDYSHTEGVQTNAKGLYSHAEGMFTKTIPKEGSIDDFWDARGAHAEGYYTIAQGRYSHAEGYETKALGYISHAGGRGTIASEYYQTVYGMYNEESTRDSNGDYALFIIGNGASATSRSNAFVVNKHGDAELQGAFRAKSLIVGAESFGKSLTRTLADGELFFIYEE